MEGMQLLIIRFLYRIHVCDLPSKYNDLQRDYESSPNITPLIDGHAVSRSSDFIIYSVEAEFIDRVVQEYGPCAFSLYHTLETCLSRLVQTATKLNAIVAGQTSVKAPERAAFEKYLPVDAQIISCHSLHGPGVNPMGQPLVCFFPSVIVMRMKIFMRNPLT
jgi:prephenate dehydrogenase (NADP+)